MHGIQSDRMAEATTGVLRCFDLDASGYVTRVQEFIALEHTAENLLINRCKESKTHRP